MPKVSVIIPVYNVESYLKECLDSVVNQTLQDIEIICVDDGSTDSSLAILQEYAQKDKRIKVVKSFHGGVGSARNRGISEATGEFICFVDADDIMAPEAVEKLLSGIQTPGCDVAIGHVAVFAKEPTAQIADLCVRKQHYYDTKFHCSGVVPTKRIMQFRGSLWGQLFRKSIIDKLGFPFPQGLIHEDEAFHWAYFARIKLAYCIEDSLYQRRIRPSSIMYNLDTKGENALDLIGILRIVHKDLVQVKKESEYRKEFARFCREARKSVLYRCGQNTTLRHTAEKELAALEEEFVFRRRFTWYEKIFSVSTSWDRRRKEIRLCGLRFMLRKKNRNIQNILA